MTVFFKCRLIGKEEWEKDMKSKSLIGIFLAIAGLIGCSTSDDDSSIDSQVSDGVLSSSANGRREWTSSNNAAVARLKAAYPRANVRVKGNRIWRVSGVVASARLPATRWRTWSSASCSASTG